MKVKKITAFLLSIAMIVGSIPSFVFAEEADEQDISEPETEQQVEEEEETSEDVEIETYGDPDSISSFDIVWRDDIDVIAYSIGAPAETDEFKATVKWSNGTDEYEETGAFESKVHDDQSECDFDELLKTVLDQKGSGTYSIKVDAFDNGVLIASASEDFKIHTLTVTRNVTDISDPSYDSVRVFLECGDHGSTVTGNPATYYIKDGSDLTVSFSTYEGYRFTGALLNGNAKDTNFDFVMQQDTSLVANYKYDDTVMK